MPDDHVLPGNTVFITRIEAARDYLRCNVTTVDRYVANGSLPRFKVGRRTLFRPSDVMKLVVPSPDQTRQTGRQDIKRGRSRGSVSLVDPRMAAGIVLGWIIVIAASVV